MRLVILLFLGLAISARMNAQPKAKILLVGTAHEFRSEFRSRQNFDSLVRKLAHFDPDLICIESIPVWDTASLRQVRARQLDQAEKLRTLTHWKNADSVIKASSERLKQFPQDLRLRENLANAFFITHDFWNAYYHWYVLMEYRLKADKKALTSLVGSFSDTLIRRAYLRQQTSEFGNVIFPLAGALGIVHLENIDDRADDQRFQTLGKHAAKRLILNFRIFKALRIYKKMKRETEDAEEEGRLLDAINDAKFQAGLVKVIDDFPERWVKSRKAKTLWDIWNTRNSRMADRIAEATRNSKSRRVIVFFGAAHIEFIRRTLAQSPDIEVILYNDLNGEK